MATRLDRLLSLLDTGSTDAVRRSAAEQLGEVQRLHPHELNNLLTKVHSYLCSNQWETRIAAGLAVDAIATRVPIWQPAPAVKTEEHRENYAAGRLQLAQFDVNKVLAHGATLLGSQGAEYDVPDVLGNALKDRLAREKILLNRSLGLDVSGGLGVALAGAVGDELFEEDDLIIEQESMKTSVMGQDTMQQMIERQLTDTNGDTATASGGYQGRGKRKGNPPSVSTTASSVVKIEDSGACVPKMRRTTSVVVDQPGNDKQVLFDSVPDATVNMDDLHEWPFDSFCELLLSDVFHANWERRHGALTALRHIVRLHGQGAGKMTSLSAEQMELANQLWLQDVTVRFLCILALDRFGDFVSDEVVAPVRETCAQALGVTVLHVSDTHLCHIVQLLVKLLDRREWEVRHGGLLGLKYVLAARQDRAQMMLVTVLPAVFSGLRDQSDDVRAVAASCLLPVVDTLVTSLPNEVNVLVSALWSILNELDDLTSSTNSIMTLLSTVLVHPLASSNGTLEQSPFQLVPRLFPFLHHSISSVRRAALNTLATLLASHKSKLSPELQPCLPAILADSLRHVYQRSLLETCPEIMKVVEKAWQELLSFCPIDILILASAPCVGTWMSLMMQPFTVPFDQGHLIEMRHAVREGTQLHARHSTDASAHLQQKYYIGGATVLGESARERDVSVTRARLTAARLLGKLSAYVSLSTVRNDGEPSAIEILSQLFCFYLSSRSALQKYCTSYVIAEWKTALAAMPSSHVDALPETLRLRLHECLTESVYYDEILVAFSRLQTECRNFAASLRQSGAHLEPSLYSPGNVLSLDQASALCSTVFDSVRSQLRPATVAQFEERRVALQTMVTQAVNDQLLLTNRVQSSISSAVVWWNCLPDKMNPVVRPLMESLKREENVSLQENSAASLSQLIQQCATKESSPNAKIIKNLCAMLCSDPKYTPLVQASNGGTSPDNTESTDDKEILTLNMLQRTQASGRGRRPGTLQKPVNCLSFEMSFEMVLGEEDETKRQILIQRRGASLALTTIARDVGTELPIHTPALWDAMLSSVKASSELLLPTTDVAKIQELVNSLQVLQVIGPSVHESLQSQLLACVTSLLSCLECSYMAVRHMASRCLAMLSRLATSQVMEQVVTSVVPLLGASDNVRRQGAIEAIALIIDHLVLDVVPYASMMIIPVLGRMSDQDESVRLMATHCFASLVRLMPLEKPTKSCGEVKASNCTVQQQHDSSFLEQLLNPSRIENYHIPIPFKAELRKYQQDGVNWLAFLSRYKLHGILCDDMGLGKTLQTLCIIASDHFYRQQMFKETGQADCIDLPSVVVCPPTLTGHWVYEIEKFVSSEHLNPLHYVGPPAERQRLQKLISEHNIVLASYDVVRNDIEFFSKIQWNYCILDEGHIIKNSKTKISKAVKQLRCNHRLILTGTPIQNNVLELWSLFDFLIPGFLGTERYFQTTYGRPILQSRDSKSSAKDQEAGVLAMESLHRQVLPFLLRRLKDEVLQDLPPKIIQDYYCDLSPLQIQLYEDFAKTHAKKSVEDSLSSELPDTKGANVPSVHIFQALQYLRKVCNHPALVVTQQHPQFAEIMTQMRREKTSLRDVQHAPKLVALQQLLNDCGIGLTDNTADVTPVVNQHRALIFCQLKGMLDIIENDLLRSLLPSVTYLRLDGNVPAADRHSIVNRFNNDPSIDVLLLTTHVGGLGLNLTGADTVIFVEHDWNPMKDLQAMDRAHRIGQKKVVNVYRLITRNTLEEKIMGLQKFKMNIANTVINEDNRSLSSMGTDQLLDLFSLGDSCQSRSSGSKDTAGQSSTGSTGSVKALLDSMEQLWSTQPYEMEYDVSSFMKSLNKNNSS